MISILCARFDVGILKRRELEDSDDRKRKLEEGKRNVRIC
jgi:hypothetical protein